MTHSHAAKANSNMTEIHFARGDLLKAVLKTDGREEGFEDNSRAN